MTTLSITLEAGWEPLDIRWDFHCIDFYDIPGPAFQRKFELHAFDESSPSHVIGVSFAWPTVSFMGDKDSLQDRKLDRRQHLCKEGVHRRSLL